MSEQATYRCPGPLDRRTWLKIGGLSFGSLVTGASPNLSGLLAAEEQSRDASRPAKDFSVILFWANGGPSHVDLFDLKSAAPAEYRGPFQPIQTNVPGMEITELLPTLARMADKFAIVRSLHHERTRARYGHTHWGRSLLTCRRLVEAGVRFVQCQAEFRLKPETGCTSNWDDHSVNSHIFKAYEEKLPSFDLSVSALIQDLADRGLSDRVLFIFCGEFGRTPLIRNQDPSGRPGRDHWSRAMSVFLAGGGLKMGQVIGATSRRGEEPIEKIMDSNCLLATIYHRFGIDTSQVFHTLAGRPIPILTTGEPIAELV